MKGLCVFSPPDSVSLWLGHPQPGSAAAPERCCCLGVVFLIIERDIKRFMVYSYRRCSSRRSIEIDTAITARLVTGCDSHMFGETKVEVAGGVPPAGWPRARLQGRDGVLGSIPEMGTGCWAGTQNPPAPTPRRHTRNSQLGSQFCRARILKEEKSNFKSALRARVFYTTFLFLSSSLWICHAGWGCSWRRVIAAVTRPGWPWSGSAASCRIYIPSPKSALRGCVW